MIIERTSVVDAPVERVWRRVVTAEGVNDEMRPVMTMSFPPGARDLDVDSLPVGTPVGRCWLRLLGLLPFDYDLLTIESLMPGRGFHEESTMLSMRRWRHERTLEPTADGRTEVRDRVIFEPRTLLRPLSPLLAAGVGAFFSHRHRRLARHFGSGG
ncbi:Uncharacterized conserved protein [Mycolicibacterium phlei]|uniref:Ligand-binding SRPBCC domain-containing protein n=1 Tax=Mycolicibacterium phlei DSM 43239 = CCUG 21000 TaxID=1226750 RepID=A0A5N5VDC8_MYCPH|nr:hypothetical protein [Mycolicibacterium phlei]VEG10003.1 Uncharacterized conserved protein [Mycobacteroides chelonae]AMO61897.1 hypothetical protein MPHLCCUG_03092 [Mycolicibacterium phlei]KAB7758469.1 hypothetical protein MPHL21000_05590 [Mycolicibacterium phlei DSM 43239 = CCUG 21000]KXW66968.1 hypothetical protein MPHL43239_06765 [Mycolicibacterium phlei DSM 43239 = CCUG 21000]KXW70572.1 hypothetical protein MPHL43072_19145 [Mycolicibacterium phlei DSM 43072]